MHCWHLIIYFFPGQLVKASPKNTFLKKAHFSGLNVISNLRFDIINDNNSSCLRSFKSALDAIKETKYATALQIFEGGHCKKTQLVQIYVWGPLNRRSWGTLKSCTEATRRRSIITFVADLRKWFSHRVQWVMSGWRTQACPLAGRSRGGSTVLTISGGQRQDINCL